MGSARVGRAHRIQRRADDLPPVDTVVGGGGRAGPDRTVARMSVAKADDERLRGPSTKHAAAMEGDHGPRPARAVRHDGSRNGSFEPPAWRTPPWACRPAAPRRVRADR